MAKIKANHTQLTFEYESKEIANKFINFLKDSNQKISSIINNVTQMDNKLIVTLEDGDKTLEDINELISKMNDKPSNS